MSLRSSGQRRAVRGSIMTLHTENVAVLPSNRLDPPRRARRRSLLIEELDLGQSFRAHRMKTRPAPAGGRFGIKGELYVLNGAGHTLRYPAQSRHAVTSANKSQKVSRSNA